MVESNTWASWPRERERAADVLLGQVAEVDAADRDPARLGIEEAQEEVGDRRLARSARADERDPAPGSRRRSKSRRARRVAGRVRGGHALESDGDRPCGARRARPGRDARLAVGEVEDAASRGERRRELARAAGSGATASNDDSASSASAATSTRSNVAGVVRGDRDGEHADVGEPGDEDGQRVREAGDERVATPEAHELAIGRADPRERVLLAAVGDELRRAAQELDELGRQLAASRGLAPAD